MKSLQTSYAKAIHSHFPKYFANFPPNSPVALGDYGVLKDGIFDRQGSGEFLGVRPEVIAAGKAGTIQFTTGDDVTVTLRGAGHVDVPGAEAQADVSIRFGNKGGVFFAAAGCQIVEFDDEKLTGDRVLEAFIAGNWKPEWVLVTRIVKAKALNLLVSEAAGAYADLDVAGTTTVNFTDVRSAAKFTIKKSRSIGCQFIGNRETVPLLSLLGVRKRPFRTPYLEHLGAQPPPENLKADRDRMIKANVNLRERFEAVDLSASDTVV